MEERGGLVVGVFPEAVGDWQVRHLPPTVEPAWSEAIKVFGVAAYASAVVQCGRTLEAAFDARKVSGGSLSDRLARAESTGLITSEFKGAMQYARLIRNTGAHAGAEVSSSSAEGVMRFTHQALRLLFEVPAELAQLKRRVPELEGVQDEPDA
jgi:hypothetical protein